MRDFNRIERIMRKIQTAWGATNPDLRFWQFMDVLKSRYAIDHNVLQTFDMFYVEDDEFEKVLDNLLSEVQG